MQGVAFRCDDIGRWMFESDRVAAADYDRLCASIVAAFDLFPNTPRITEGETTFQDFSRGEQLVGLEWDTRCGFRVVALTPDSERLIRQIGVYLHPVT